MPGPESPGCRREIAAAAALVALAPLAVVLRVAPARFCSADQLWPEAPYGDLSTDRGGSAAG